MKTNLSTSRSIKIFVAVQECQLNNPTAQRLEMAFLARAHTQAQFPSKKKNAIVQRRCKDSIVITTDSDVGPEGNVTQTMTHKSQATVTQPRPRNSL